MSGLDTDVVLLLHMNGSNNGTVILDASYYAGTATAVGSAVTITTSPKFGSACLSVPGSDDGSTRVEVAFDPIYGIVGNFTIDFWMKCGTIEDTVTILPFYHPGLYDEVGLAILNNGSGPVMEFSIAGNANSLSVDYSSYDDGAWHHIAIVGSSTTIYFFIDGDLKDSEAGAGTWDSTSVDSDIVIGDVFVDGVTDPAVKIDELRLSKVARWTSNFSVPVAEYSGSAGLYCVKPVVELSLAMNPHVAPVLLSFPQIDITTSLTLTASHNVAVLPDIALSCSFSAYFPGSLEVVTSNPTFSSHGLSDGMGELNVVAELPVAAFSGYVDNIGELVVVAQESIFIAEGVTDSIGTLQVVAQSAQFAADGICDSISILVATTEPATFSSSGVVDISGTLAVLSEEATFASLGIVDNVAVLRAITSVCAFKAFAVASTAVTYCLNLLKKGLVSTFTSHNFVSYAKINGVMLGADAVGLYQLTGNLDKAAAIDAIVTFPLSDYGTPLTKQIRMIRLVIRSSGSLKVTVNDGNANTWNTTIAPVGLQYAESVLVPFPFTTQGRVLQVSIENVSGCYFFLDYAELLLYTLGRA